MKASRSENKIAQILQGGIRHRGDHLDTKAELKELVEDQPHRLEFYCTSQFPPTAGVTFMVSELKEGQLLTIVGPDPRHERKWYANIKRTPTGKLRVT